MAQQGKHLYGFGPFSLDPEQRVLLRDGRPVPLTPKAFDTLQVLVENAGRITEKDQLLKRVWADTFVEEATLAKNISTLRKALGDSPEGEAFIQTVTKRGYRFVAAVQRIDSSERTLADETPPEPSTVSTLLRVRPRTAPWSLGAPLLAVALAVAYLGFRHGVASTAAPAAPVVVAVMPFENLSGDPSQEYLGDGLTEELISQLSQVNPQRLGVIARTTVMRYKSAPRSAAEIGRELNAGYIVEGSFRREGNRLRIVAQLIETHGQTHVWTKDYERELQQLIPLQREVSYSIARSVAVQVSPPGVASRQAATSQAYDDYLRARFYWNKRTQEDRLRAREYFNSAIAGDAGFAPAYAGLAETYVDGGPKAVEDFAVPLVSRALALDPLLPEGHVSAGIVELYRCRWEDAGRALRRATELDPNSANARLWYAVYLRSQGRLAEALAENERALVLDPLSSLAHHEIGVTHSVARRYAQAVPFFRRALELEPTHIWSRVRLIQVFALQGARLEAQAEMSKLPPEYTSSSPRIAHVYALLGNPNKARAILETGLRDPGSTSPLDFAAAYAALGEADRAFEFLDSDHLTYKYDTVLFKMDPRFDPLRVDPRFSAVLKKMRLDL